MMSSCTPRASGGAKDDPHGLLAKHLPAVDECGLNGFFRIHAQRELNAALRSRPRLMRDAWQVDAFRHKRRRQEESAPAMTMAAIAYRNESFMKASRLQEQNAVGNGDRRQDAH